jgi:hypothetical protein
MDRSWRVKEGEIMKRVRNLYNDRSMPKTGTFYPTGKYIKSRDNVYQLFHRNKALYYVDIPIRSNDIGIIERGYFVKCFSAHPTSKEFFYKASKLQDIVTEKNTNIESEARTIIKEFKHRRSND